MRRLPLLLASLLAACGTEPSNTEPPGAAVEPDGGSAADASTSDAGADAGFGADASVPRLFFTQGEGSAAQEVVSVVYAQPYDVRAEGLPPGATVTLFGALWGYRSQADFVVDAQGTVDLARDPPLAGTYQGVDADGLVWSMVLKSTATAPDYDVSYTLRRAQQQLAQAKIQRRALGSDATVTALDQNGLVGTLYVPSGATPKPALLVLGGSEGGTPDFSGAYYESMGYVTLALAYFGEPGLPTELTDVPLEYFDAAIDWMRARPEIDPLRIGVAGGSRGGELALILGARRSDLRAVVASVPSGLVMGSAGRPGRAAWTSGGVPLAYFDVPTAVRPVEEQLPSGEYGLRMAPVTDAQLDAATTQDIDRVRIHIEDAQGPVLLLAGADDGLWPSCRLAKISWDALLAAGHPARFADGSTCFPDAGHSLGSPGWPTAESYAFSTGPGSWLILGGTPAGTGHAQRQGDTKVRQFLEAALGH